jgi:predicted ferric reductase
MNPGLKVHVRFSAIDGSLTVEEIVKNAGGDLRGYDIYLCGPLPMIQAFTRKFQEQGVLAKNIHYEEFNFR